MDDLIILYGTLFLMLAAACGWLVWNVMRASAPGADASAQGLQEALRAEKRRLDDELAAGVVTPELYASLLEDLRRRALEETGAAESLDALHAARSAEAERRRAKLAGVVLAVLIGVSAGSYALLGAPEMMRLADDQAVLQGRADVEKITAYLEDNPKDVRAWVQLAHRRIEAGELKPALEAYARAAEAAGPEGLETASAVEFATLVYTMKNPHAYEAADRQIELALKRSPDDPKALELAAMGAVSRGRWAEAAEHLERRLQGMKPSDPERGAVEKTLEAIRRRALEAGPR